MWFTNVEFNSLEKFIYKVMNQNLTYFNKIPLHHQNLHMGRANTYLSANIDIWEAKSVVILTEKNVQVKFTEKSSKTVGIIHLYAVFIMQRTCRSKTCY